MKFSSTTVNKLYNCTIVSTRLYVVDDNIIDLISVTENYIVLSTTYYCCREVISEHCDNSVGYNIHCRN